MPENRNKVTLLFKKEFAAARFISPSGETVEELVEIRTSPVTGRTSRISFCRIAEREAGTESLPAPPPEAEQPHACPFCRPQVMTQTPRMLPSISEDGRFQYGQSLLFPNLFPYGSYSAVSIFDNTHFVEIGTASLSAYADCFINCARYLITVLAHDPTAVYMAITQNHLPSAGGSLIHPHLQINADRIPTNYQRCLQLRTSAYHKQTGRLLFSDYLDHERADGNRYIGTTGNWEWTAAYAPEGFYEIWGVLPSVTSFQDLTDPVWQDLAEGILNTQRLYRSLNRNGYNLGMLFMEDDNATVEIRLIMMVRSNYAPWVRNDHTGFEVMLGDMTTFTAPEETAKLARPFWD